MSKMNTRELQCPHCGNRQDTEVWDSINVSLDPVLKEKLFQGEINSFNCQKCEHTFCINKPLLYHDMEQNFCVYYFPPEALDDLNFFSQFNRQGGFEVAGIPEELADLKKYLAHPHLVFDMAEMVRYIYFRDKLGQAKADAEEVCAPTRIDPQQNLSLIVWVLERLQKEGMGSDGYAIFDMNYQGQSVYIQCMGGRESPDLYVEAVSNYYLADGTWQLSAEQIAKIESAQWKLKEEGNFSKEMKAGEESKRMEVAQEFVRTFREVYGVPADYPLEAKLNLDGGSTVFSIRLAES